MEENGFADAWLHPCDVSSDESIHTFFEAAKAQFGQIDFVVRSHAMLLAAGSRQSRRDTPAWQRDDPQDPKGKSWYSNGAHLGIRVVRED